MNRRLSTKERVDNLGFGFGAQNKSARAGRFEARNGTLHAPTLGLDSVFTIIPVVVIRGTAQVSCCTVVVLPEGIIGSTRKIVVEKSLLLFFPKSYALFRSAQAGASLATLVKGCCALGLKHLRAQNPSPPPPQTSQPQVCLLTSELLAAQHMRLLFCGAAEPPWRS